MAKTPNSKCSIESMGAGLAALNAKFGDEGRQLATDSYRTMANAAEGTTPKNAALRGQAVAKAFAAIKNRLDLGKDKNSIIWTTEDGLKAAATKGEVREVADLNLMNQHAVVNGQAEVTAMARAAIKPVQKGKERAEWPSNKPMPKAAVTEAITRMNLMGDTIRNAGVPLVTSMAKSSDELFHISHLDFGSGLKAMLDGADNADDVLSVYQKAFFSKADPTGNVFFQNTAEAFRRVIEHFDLERLADKNGLKALQDQVRDALENASGKAVSSDARAALALNKKWLATEEGISALDDLTDLIMRSIDPILKADRRNKLITGVLAKGDGMRMADQVMRTLGKQLNAFDELQDMGELLYGGGMRQIFDEDMLAKAHPDKINLAFAEQVTAKILNQIHPVSQAQIKVQHQTIKAVAKDSQITKSTGQVTKTNRNAKNVDENAEMQERSKDLTKNQMENDPNVLHSEVSEEAARISIEIYNELHFGTMMGGMVKLIAKTSDFATMGKGKTLLLGTQDTILRNSVSTKAGLASLRKELGNDTAKVNDMFARFKDADSSQSLDDVVNNLPAELQEIGNLFANEIRHIFGAGDVNNMMAHGIFVDEYANALRMADLPRYADDLVTSGNIDPADFANYWKGIELAEGEDALDVMYKFYAAGQLAQLKPTLAASLINHFNPKAYGLTRAEAVAQGWKAVDPEPGGLAEYLTMGKDAPLFSPDMVEGLRNINAHLNYEKGGFLGIKPNTMRRIDSVTSMMKSSLTIWRPGHHVVSTMGNTFMNVLAGVMPNDYRIGFAMLGRRGLILDNSAQGSIDRIAAAHVEEGYKFTGALDDAVSIPIIGAKGTTYQKLNLDGVLKGADQHSVTIQSRITADQVREAEDTGSLIAGGVMKVPGAKAIATVDSALGQAAAVRDNAARYALFVKELQKGGPYRSLEDAFLSAAEQVHKYHPTVGTLTAWERKNARRAFYFYTWQKQAFFKIMEYAANSKVPALTMPSKMQYAIAEAQGFEPDSFGDPHNPASMIAAYNSYSTYGPMWEDERWGKMGVKPALPQFDVIDGYLGQIEWKPEDGLWGNLGNLFSTTGTGIVGANAPPMIKIPAELMAKRRFGGIGGEITDAPQYLLDSTGVGTLSRIFDWTPWGNRSDTKLDPFADANRQRLLANWISGMKLTYYESPSSVQTGRQEMVDYWQKTYKVGRAAPKPSIYDR